MLDTEKSEKKSLEINFEEKIKQFKSENKQLIKNIDKKLNELRKMKKICK